MITSKLTSKAQTTIPQPVRVALGLREGDEIAYRLEADRPDAAGQAVARSGEAQLKPAEPAGGDARQGQGRPDRAGWRCRSRSGTGR